MILNESDASVSDGDNGSFFYDFCIVSNEESISASSVICNHYFNAFNAAFSLNFFDFDYFHIDIVSTEPIFQSI